MNKKYLLIALTSVLLLSGCSKNDDDKNKYYNVVAPQMVQGLYRQHASNLSYLSEYTYEEKSETHPAYATIGMDTSKHTKSTTNVKVGVYSGVFVASKTVNSYIGNQIDAGIKSSSIENNYYWFENTEYTNTKQLTQRHEIADRDQKMSTEDTKTSIFVNEKDVPNYFSGAINDDQYSQYFEYKLVPLINAVSVQKSSTTIVSTTYTIEQDPELIVNPDYPDDDSMKLVAFNEIETTTIFRLIDGIGWVGTNFDKTSTSFVATDNLHRLQTTKNVIGTQSISVTFSYSKSVIPYTGGLSYKEHDSNNEKFLPTLYELNEEGTMIDEIMVARNITDVYHSLHPSYEGYAYNITFILSEGAFYGLTNQSKASEGVYDYIGFKQISENAGGFVIKGNELEESNSFTIFGESFLADLTILVDSNGTYNLQIRFA